jgi:hypothetical protein
MEKVRSRHRADRRILYVDRRPMMVAERDRVLSPRGIRPGGPDSGAPTLSEADHHQGTQSRNDHSAHPAVAASRVDAALRIGDPRAAFDEAYFPARRCLYADVGLGSRLAMCRPGDVVLPPPRPPQAQGKRLSLSEADYARLIAAAHRTLGEL